jgi:hypothetical protein
MPDYEKRSPEPPDPVEVIGATLARAAEGQVDADLSISFRVAGGPPRARYRLEFRVDQGRLMSGELECDLKNRRVTADQREADRAVVSSLARELLDSGFLTAPAVTPRFLPDTLVGIIDVSGNGRHRRVYFAADADQAAVQGLSTPPAVLRAADALYGAAAGVLGREDVRP